MIRVTTPWLMMQCPTSHKHKKMVKIGRVYMIADRQTHWQTDTLIAIRGGVINRVGGQAVRKLRLETDRQTDTTDRITFLVNAVTIKWSDEAVGWWWLYWPASRQWISASSSLTAAAAVAASHRCDASCNAITDRIQSVNQSTIHRSSIAGGASTLGPGWGHKPLQIVATPPNLAVLLTRYSMFERALPA